MSKVASFGDIGKPAGDLLNKGFDVKQTVTLNAASTDGTKVTIKSTKDGEKLSGDIKLAKSLCPAFNLDVSITSDSKVSFTGVAPSLYKGLKCTLAGSLPDHTSGKLTLDYAMPHLNTKTVIGLTSSPLLNLTATTGSSGAIMGGDVAYDTGKSAITKWSVGAGYIGPDYNAGVVLSDKGNTVKATYSQVLDPTQSVGCEVVRKLSSDATTFTVGYSKALDTGAILKMRLASSGMGALSYQFIPAPKTTVTLSGQFDTMNLDKNTKLGVALDAKA
mmetsp:Transcript_24169/g.61952  ORF Transcript_24169/g.61952 Transcript_24169/m.61952 type:complete len:275 (+) Transcript_24169:95-919(+)|eukprot:jgi/Tetstr1/464671/TSEL_009425.t1